MSGCESSSAATDGPNRLVGEHGLGQGGHAALGDDRVQLAAHHLLGDAAFAFLQGLADAEDGGQAGGLGGGELLRHHGIALAEEGAALGVADDDVGATEILEHGRRNLTGVGTLGVLAEILRTPGDLGPGEPGLHLRQVGKRHAYRHADLAVHFPVAGHQFATHGFPLEKGREF